MRNILNKFYNTQNKIFESFDIKNEYLLRIDLYSKWTIEEIEGTFFLKYWDDKNEQTNVIVKQDNVPLISDKNGYTMIVAIDCIKISIVFNNSNKI